MLYEPLAKLFYKNNVLYESIYEKRFNNESTHHYDFSVGENKAFLVVNLEVLNLITSILQLDKKLLKLTKLLPPIALTQFTIKCIVDEIQLTNEIEGVYSTRKEIRELIYENNKKINAKRKRLYGLVQKYLMLSDGQKINLKNCQDIRILYDEFVLAEVKSYNKENIPDGRVFRKEIVEIVSQSQKVIHKGLYPEEKIIMAMTAALEVLHDDSLNYFVNIAVFNYMFAYIHPFYDGNGRMARFISSYLLNRKLEPIVGFALSYTIKNNIKKYYELFKLTNDFRNKGDLTPFVIGFLEFIKEAIASLCTTIEGRAEQLYFYTSKIEKYTAGNKNIKAILYVLVQNALFDDEGIDIRSLSKATKIGLSTVRDSLRKIPKEILIVKKTGKMNVYSANLELMV